MEPPLGTISFLLLSLQFARQQTYKLWASSGGQGPYNAWLKRRRYRILKDRYPQYSPIILAEYSSVLSARCHAITNQTDVYINVILFCRVDNKGSLRALDNDEKYPSRNISMR